MHLRIKLFGAVFAKQTSQSKLPRHLIEEWSTFLASFFTSKSRGQNIDVMNYLNFLLVSMHQPPVASAESVHSLRLWLGLGNRPQVSSNRRQIIGTEYLNVTTRDGSKR